jgi:DNA-directed RNA polymerase subunit RPC12/RpoP
MTLEEMLALMICSCGGRLHELDDRTVECERCGLRLIERTNS